MGSVRVASSEDVSAIVTLVRAGSEEGVFYFNPSHSFSVEEQIESFRDFAFENRPKGYQILVFEAEDTIIGYVDSEVNRGVGLILGIYVNQNHRRKGVGKKLIESMLKDCRRQGCHKARLEVLANNHKAIGFYKHLGFIQEGYLRKDQENKDTVIMSKFL